MKKYVKDYVKIGSDQKGFYSVYLITFRIPILWGLINIPYKSKRKFVKGMDVSRKLPKGQLYNKELDKFDF